VLLVTLGNVVGCGTKSNPIVSQLPSSDAAQINKILNGNRDFELPTSLPFKATHGTAAITTSIDSFKAKHGTTSIVSTLSIIKKPVNQLVLKLYNKKESLIIYESTAGGAVPSLPNGPKLTNGLPAEFEQINGETELSWSNSKVFFQLYAQPSLPKKELLQIADSIGQ